VNCSPCFYPVAESFRRFPGSKVAENVSSVSNGPLFSATHHLFPMLLDFREVGDHRGFVEAPRNLGLGDLRRFPAQRKPPVPLPSFLRRITGVVASGFFSPSQPSLLTPPHPPPVLCAPSFRPCPPDAPLKAAHPCHIYH